MDGGTCGLCHEPLEATGRCINQRFHEQQAIDEEHARRMQDANDVIVELFHAAQRMAAVLPNCEGLLRSLLRASEWLRQEGIKR